MCQMRVETGDLAGNLERAVRMIREAAAQGCQIAVLPECLDLGWTCASARDLAHAIPGEPSDYIRAAAAAARIQVVAGLTERCGVRIYNTALLIAPDGGIVLRHRKINELDIAQDLYSIGNSLEVAESIAVNICADNFPDSLALGHSLARMGCRLLLSPCAWAVDADHDNRKDPYGSLWLESYTTLARLYDMTVVGVSNVGWLRDGPWKGRKCIGCSLAVGPGGRVLAQGPYGENAEAVIPVEVEIRDASARGTAIAGMLSAKGYDGP
jgi:predicted amidohydrolase